MNLIRSFVLLASFWVGQAAFPKVNASFVVHLHMHIIYFAGAILIILLYI